MIHDAHNATNDVQREESIDETRKEEEEIKKKKTKRHGRNNSPRDWDSNEPEHEKSTTPVQYYGKASQ